MLRFIAVVLVLVAACGTSASTPAQTVQCGTTTCTSSQTCITPCVDDLDCAPFADAGPTCPAGYQQGTFCCYPPPAPPHCVDDVHKLDSKACGDGQPQYELDGGFMGCMCTV